MVKDDVEIRHNVENRNVKREMLSLSQTFSFTPSKEYSVNDLL